MQVSEEIEIKLKLLQKWFKDNPKLPQEIDPILLKRFLKCMYNDLEETKKLLELNYMLRNKYPHIFINRDPNADDVTLTRAYTDLIALPGLTPDRCKVFLFRLADYDASKVNTLGEMKVYFMISDCRLTMPDFEEDNNDGNCDDIADGDIQITDIGGYSMSHITRMSILTLRIYMRFTQEAYPVRVRAIHVINCPSFLNKMIAFLKPFIRDDVYKMIHFHTGGYESLYEYIPRDMLPNEYGGKAGTVADLKKKWNYILNEKKNYLMDSKYWKIEATNNTRNWLWF